MIRSFRLLLLVCVFTVFCCFVLKQIQPKFKRVLNYCIDPFIILKKFKNKLFCLFIHWFVRPPVHKTIYYLIYVSVDSFSFSHFCVRKSTGSFNLSIIYSLINAFIHSFIHFLFAFCSVSVCSDVRVCPIIHSFTPKNTPTQNLQPSTKMLTYIKSVKNVRLRVRNCILKKT